MLHLQKVLVLLSVTSLIFGLTNEHQVQAQNVSLEPKEVTSSVSGLSASDRQHFLQDKFAIVKTVQALPKAVQKQVLGKESREGMADAGQPYEVSDAVGPKPRPFRRLVFAGVSPGFCFVYNEHGGIAYRTEISLYRLSGRQATLVWSATLRRSHGFLSLPELRNEIRQNHFQTYG